MNQLYEVAVLCEDDGTGVSGEVENRGIGRIDKVQFLEMHSFDAEVVCSPVRECG